MIRPDPALRRATGRVVLYMYSSLYLLLALEPLMVAGVLVSSTGPTAGSISLGPMVSGLTTALVIGGVVLVHTAASVAWLWWVLRSQRHDDPVPRRGRPWLVVYIGWTLLTAALIVLTGPPIGWPLAALLVIVFAVSVFAPRLPWWVALLTPLAATIVVVVAGLLLRPDDTELSASIGALVGAGIWFPIITMSYWLTGWMVRVVYALDDARGQAAQLAIAEERLRISRDLHDVFGRTLATVSVKSALAAELARRGRSDQAAEEITAVREIADDAGKEVRRIVAGVREADLDQELVGARALLVAAGIDCRLDRRVPEGTVDREVAAVLGAIVRESVTNLIRHSSATEAVITLIRTDGRVELVVDNDGVTTTGDPAPGNGLAGMDQRLAAVGGTLRVRREAPRFRLVAAAPDPGGPVAGRHAAGRGTPSIDAFPRRGHP